MKDSVGLVGIGNMGSKIAGNIINSGREVLGFDKLPAGLENLKSIQGRPASSLEQVANEASPIILSLPRDSDVIEAATELIRLAATGTTIIDMSTVSPDTTIQMAASAKEKGIHYIDAPVLGRPENIGQWTLPCGGEREVVESCKPVLSALAKQIVYVGKSGSGNVVKILNNMMTGVNNTLMCEILSLCKALDLDPRVFYETVVQSPALGVSRLFEKEVPRVLQGNLKTVFSVDLMLKDLTLASHLAEQKNHPLFLTPAAQLVYQIAKSSGMGTQDMASLGEIWEEFSPSKKS